MRIADLHIHSKYSRPPAGTACPRRWISGPGGRVSTWWGRGTLPTRPGGLSCVKCLEEAEDGLYVLKSGHVRPGAPGGGAVPRFVVSGEISSIYKKNGRVRKVHSLILLPSLEAAEVLSHRLEAIGNIHSDGRPILGLDCRDPAGDHLEAAPGAIFIPAHIWTPHFSLFGAFSALTPLRSALRTSRPTSTPWRPASPPTRP